MNATDLEKYLIDLLTHHLLNPVLFDFNTMEYLFRFNVRELEE